MADPNLTTTCALGLPLRHLTGADITANNLAALFATSYAATRALSVCPAPSNASTHQLAMNPDPPVTSTCAMSVSLFLAVVR